MSSYPRAELHYHACTGYSSLGRSEGGKGFTFVLLTAIAAGLWPTHARKDTYKRQPVILLWKIDLRFKIKSDRHLSDSDAEAQPEADVFCVCQV
ncbi:MAG TPA: hypothetical protein DIC52_19740, partial [Candidatus Latescibacteria bacterium]|nr:hypothetical protein [Candidatus Latescibacterota bacterium]